ncbi:hypothetical protein U8C32_33555 (plasmid) [Sinorhizobium medicae]|uniref:hypothetical protein n=1 Tax=Sinorhizobium medicae TaxID=110321 RepID=UPI002AF6C9A5|nr:hypothetical protein [Sinorhizobium medicae]WQO49129.1 hypothetical protein U8C42_35260 [Sinorhizobium medicae]WQO69193.1 hypothetical protein U8C40_34285 [Sinorhizobium medicae]WQO76326.1 hypothetical protein U8C31_34580 [Sinorhizobium medicae]WQO95500.1 hypothetical protein U8C32_33555 [Sinorhizobium medicae]
MSDLPKPKYKWRQTWPNHPKHFCGDDGSRHIASIYWNHMGWWNWFMWNWAKNASRWKRPNGQAGSAREAALEAEKCYEAILRCEWPGIAPEDLQCMLGYEEWMRTRP